MEIKKEVFRAYDIRGVYPDEINEDLAYRLGRVFPVFLKKEKSITPRAILVNRDTRASSRALQAALMRGLSEEGVKVLDGGVSTTPMHYFGVGTFAVEAGIMVTASHGSALQNGFKLSTKKERIASDSGLWELQLEIQKELAPAVKYAEIRPFEYRDRYIQFLKKFVQTHSVLRKLNVVIDASAGAAGDVLRECILFLPIDATKLFFDPDPFFQVHSPNPLLPESQEFLKENLKKTYHDFGVLFDGDGDRVIFFDEFGTAVPSDVIAALIAGTKLKTKEFAKVLFDVNASRASRQYIIDRKGLVETIRVGTSFFRNALEKDQSIIMGSESSGHFYYPEFFNSDAAIVTFIYVLNILNRTQQTLNQLTAPMMTAVRSGELNFVVADKHALLKKIEEAFPDATISKIDGLMVEYPDWWFTIRPSNTEDLIRVHIEADSHNLLTEKKSALENLIGA